MPPPHAPLVFMPNGDVPVSVAVSTSMGNDTICHPDMGRSVGAVPEFVGYRRAGT